MTSSPLGLLVKARRPKRPGRHHLLVLSSSIGYLVFWTKGPDDRTDPSGKLDRTLLDRSLTLVSGFPLRRIRYHLATVAVFRYLALDLKIIGPRAQAAAPAVPAATVGADGGLAPAPSNVE